MSEATTPPSSWPEPPEGFHRVVRENIGMYLGGNQPEGILRPLADAVIDAVERQQCQHVSLTIAPGGCWTIEDDGRWLDEAEPAGAGIRRLTHGLRDSTFASRMIQALAADYTLELCGNGSQARQHFLCGEAAEPIAEGEPTDRTGRRQQFTFDPSLFTGDCAAVPSAPLRGRLHDIAAIKGGVAIDLNDQRSDLRERYLFPQGLRDYLELLVYSERADEPIIALSAEDSDGNRMSLAFRLSFYRKGVQCSFANYRVTGGLSFHETGMLDGLRLALERYALERQLWPEGADMPALAPSTLRRFLDFALAIHVADPEWKTARGYEIGSRKAYRLVRDALIEQLPSRLTDLNRLPISWMLDHANGDDD